MTKEKFLKYEEIRASGATNMFSVMTVVNYSDGILNKEDCLDIMKNYSKYKKEYL